MSLAENIQKVRENIAQAAREVDQYLMGYTNL